MTGRGLYSDGSIVEMILGDVIMLRGASFLHILSVSDDDGA